MANIFDYLAWRGDITLAQSPFNAVDSLILSVLSYLPFDDMVRSTFDRKGVTIAEAQAAFGAHDAASLSIRSDVDVQLLAALAASARFATMRLTGYVSEHNEAKQEQFAAMSIRTGDGANYISFRGTDHSLVGWKEDFNMSFMTPVPAQRDAVSYLEQAARHLGGPLRVGGHSKGGNLAVYSSAFCGRKIQKRIVSVYNNDGPGFDESVIAAQGFRDIEGRLFAYVPQSSIIGMLLEHTEQYAIVHSVQKGIMQHDPYSWSVLGKEFVVMDTVTNTSLFIDKTVKQWISSMQPSQRAQFINALYEILAATDIKDITEPPTDWFKRARAAGEALRSIDNETRKALLETLRLLFHAARNNLSTYLPPRGDRADPVDR
ncbi:MAG TPA: DUF2974 domain-containing protein [bacterium]|nr:DUF2974 domain-containing protein [bacterium]